ncbi:L-aspartate oxidase [Brevundimonas sp. 2R-24]|uniref:L-aspartate oxidase n=1 Tax=Peiella sedimenti TaxID=3061083 RepID=A0ABT8SPH5_9CAUL|nr:L-aspartate oxidase [Caulobacteraceae bacterium XZ-24]
MTTQAERRRFDGIVVVGAGLAGLSAALSAGPCPVLLVSPAPLGQGCASAWAQGGVAAAVGEDDSPALHADDTLAAGAGLCDPEAVRDLAASAPQVIERLLALGAPFDRDATGRLLQSLEAAHSRPRVARIGGDGAGLKLTEVVMRAVLAAAHVTVLESATLRGLMTGPNGEVRGVVLSRGQRVTEIAARAVILATGGLGGLYAVTTNPPQLQGHGLAVAARAGAKVADAEFVQFHPTALDVGADPAPLLTEALRGEGARLIGRDGSAVMEGVHPLGDLAPRDVVAAAVHTHAHMHGQVFLDARVIGSEFPSRFPGVFEACRRFGLDPRDEPLPVAPAAHYHMGGVHADLHGRTSLANLFAAGECARTGVHGANRLASNALLEAALAGHRAGLLASAASEVPGRIATRGYGLDLPPQALAQLRQGMSRHAGVVRDEAGLNELLGLIARLESGHPDSLSLTAARILAAAALARRESRGAHLRSDGPVAPVHSPLQPKAAA